RFWRKNTFLRFWQETTFYGFSGKSALRFWWENTIYGFMGKMRFCGFGEKTLICDFDGKTYYYGFDGKHVLQLNTFSQFWRENVFLLFWRENTFLLFLAGKHVFAVLTGKCNFGGKRVFAVLAKKRVLRFWQENSILRCWQENVFCGEDLVYCKKGDNSWKQFSEGIQDQEDMVFKDHKLYCLAYDALHIFDFSGEFPLQVSRVSVGGLMRLHGVPLRVQAVRMRNSVVVTLIIRPAPRKEMLIAGEDWPYDPERKAMRIEEE
ncbi:unnamed protein product, partial [Brassica oleracea]